MNLSRPKSSRRSRDPGEYLSFGQEHEELAFELSVTSERVQLLVVVAVALFAATMYAGLNFAGAFLFPSLILGLVMSLAVPGFMLIRLFHIRCRAISEAVVYSIGASIFALLTVGLLINTLLPLAEVTRPLSSLPLTIMLVGLNLVLVALSRRLPADLSFQVRIPKMSSWVALMYVIPPLFAVLGIMGAVGLNNGASNLPVMIVLGGMGIFSLLLLFFKERMPRSLYPYSLYFMTLALLLGISLRGWVISGHDILYEFAVFQMTKSFAHWSIDYYRDAYNACLSITLLPAMLSGLLPKIPDQLIFRVIFQAIFALAPVALFRFLRNYLSRATAFMACLFFISQPALLQDFAFLTRQELALFFDVLVLLSFSSKALSRFQQYVLAGFFGVSMIWSHYSTTYIAIAILLFVLLVRNRVMDKVLGLAQRVMSAFSARIISRTLLSSVNVVTSRPFRDLTGDEAIVESRRRWLPGWRYVILLLALTMAWNIGLIGTQNNLTNFISSVYQNVAGGKGIGEYKAGLTDQIKIYNNSATQADVMDAFINTRTGGPNTTELPRFTPDTYRSYNPKVAADIMFNPGGEAADSLYSYGEIFKKFAKVFIIVGALWIIFSGMASFIVDYDLKVLMSMNIFVLGLALVMPLFSEDYSLMRAFQQLLIVLSLPAVIGAYVSLKLIFRKFAFQFATVFFVAYFLLLASFLPQLLCFGYAQMHLNNWGLYYDIHFSHQSEFDAINWLANHVNADLPVFTDFYARKKIEVFSPRSVWVVDNVLPQNINRDAYVFVDFTNKNKGLAYSPFRGNELSYRFPSEFLAQQKDVIYSNGETEIMK